MPPINSNHSKMSVGNKKNNSIAKDEETGISHDCTMYRGQNNSSLWTQDRCLFALQIISAIFVCACVMFLIGSSLFQTKVNQTFTSMSSQRHVWKVPLSSERYLDEANDLYDDFFSFVDDDGLDHHRLNDPDVSHILDIIGLLLISMSLILYVAGGVGAGGIEVTILIIVMGFPPKPAIALSCCAKLGVSIASTLMNAPKRHPHTNRPIIDWDLILVMEPLTLLGTICGTLLNRVLDDKIIVTVLVFTLVVIAHHTFKKAKKMNMYEEACINRVQWARAKKRNLHKPLNREENLSTNLVDEADPPFIPKVLPDNDLDTSSETTPMQTNKQSGGLAQKTSDVEEVQKTSDVEEDYYIQGSGEKPYIEIDTKDMSVKSSLIEEEADPLPQSKITYIITSFLFVIATNALKGGPKLESPLGIQCGSITFWAIDILTALWLIGWTYFNTKDVLRRHAVKEAVGFDYVTGDIMWDIRTVVIYPTACLIAGMVSGMCGFGSAIVTAPMMIGVGVNPSVAAATSSCMNVFTTLAATSSFVVLGPLPDYNDYATILFVVGFASTYFGRVLMLKSGKSSRIDRHSHITRTIGWVALISALGMSIEALFFHDNFNHVEEEEFCNV